MTVTPKLGVDQDGILVVLLLPKFLADTGHASTPPFLNLLYNFQPLNQKTIQDFRKTIRASLHLGCGTDSTG